MSESIEAALKQMLQRLILSVDYPLYAEDEELAAVVKEPRDLLAESAEADWKDLLLPFGRAFYEFEQRVAARIFGKTEEELAALYAATTRVSNVNIRNASFRAAPFVAEAIQNEHRRCGG